MYFIQRKPGEDSQPTWMHPTGTGTPMSSFQLPLSTATRGSGAPVLPGVGCLFSKVV